MKAGEADQQLQELLSEMLDGNLDQEAARQLQERLRNDEQAQALYLDVCEMHASLAWQHGQVIAQVEPPAVPAKRSRKSSYLGWIAAVAASLLLIAGLWAFRRTDPIPSGPSVASIEKRINAKVLAGSHEWSRNEICTGSYELNQGIIQLRYKTGVTVLIEAPAMFDAVNSERLALYSGRLSANVPPEGIGFTVETAEAEVVDFGTEFSVEAVSGESEVHVFDGHVRVHPKSLAEQESESVDLRTLEAIRIADVTRQPSGIDLAKDRFIRSIDEPSVKYSDMVRAFDPLAYYRMPIRQQGLVCSPEEYSGRVLIGEGRRPACAPGVLGGALRSGGRSVGRGAVVDHPPLLSGQLTMSVWVYADSRPKNARLMTNMSRNQQGCFAWMLDEKSGRLKINVRDQEKQSVTSIDPEPIPLKTWLHYAASLDGELLKLYRDGQLIDTQPCRSLADSTGTPLFFGANFRGNHVWDGRIDEFAIFDHALTDDEIRSLANVR